MSRYIDADAVKNPYGGTSLEWQGILLLKLLDEAPSIDLDDYVPKDFHDKTCEAMAKAHQEEIADMVSVVRCKECKHRPIKEDADGENYGFNVIAPNGDERCPCLVEDGWYSWIPKDDFYCGYGEREGE